jgi:polyisoprenoid-binding protein YceI
MVTWVRGHFKDVHGSLEFDPATLTLYSVEATLDAGKLWTGEPQRDAHLRSGDFLDAQRHPSIAFKSTGVERVGGDDYKVTGGLTLRGITHTVTLDMHYLGKWRTPYNEASVTRVGFVGRTSINRRDFGVNWDSPLEDGGRVVGNEVHLLIDAEGILEAELRPILEAANR